MYDAKNIVYSIYHNIYSNIIHNTLDCITYYIILNTYYLTFFQYPLNNIYYIIYDISTSFLTFTILNEDSICLVPEVIIGKQKKSPNVTYY